MSWSRNREVLARQRQLCDAMPPARMFSEREVRAYAARQAVRRELVRACEAVLALEDEVNPILVAHLHAVVQMSRPDIP